MPAAPTERDAAARDCGDGAQLGGSARCSSIEIRKRVLSGTPAAAAALAEISRLLTAATGRSVTSIKDATFRRRVCRRMAALGINEIEAYVKTLRSTPDELRLLAKDMLIHVTAFFRDPGAFEGLSRTVVSKLVRQHPRNEPLRIWAAGCSTGEEAYSIAIMFIEEITRAKRELDLQIFASDISEAAIARARAGHYPCSIRRHVSLQRLRRFFVKDEHGYRVAPRLRESVLFVVHDLFGDAPFSRLDLVVCRNVLIYMRREMQDKLLSLFHFSLKERGVLFVGVADTIGASSNGFRPISYEDRLFERVQTQRKPFFPSSFPRSREGLQPMPSKDARHIDTPAIEQAAQQFLLQRYGLASIVINQRHEIVWYSGAVAKYLKVEEPEIGGELLSLLSDGVVASVVAAVRRASQQAAPAMFGARLERGGRLISVAISAQPLKVDGEEVMLVSLSDDESPADESALVHRDEAALVQVTETARIARLERELVVMRARLEKTIRDLELANQELVIANQEAMSVNEDLQSMNEEIEASKEEMESLNDELLMLNQQLQNAAEQQKSNAADLRNILNSSDVATLFLDKDFNIRFFTPPATALFGLIAADVGRPLADLAPRFTDHRLLEDARNVLANLLPSRREILTKDDLWFLRKIAPYRNEHGSAEGVVITFANITDIKHVERDVRASHAFAESVVETVREPLLVFSQTMSVSTVNKAFRDLFCGRDEDFSGLPLAETPARALAPLMQDTLKAMRDGFGPVENYRVEIEVPAKGRRVLLTTTREIGGHTSVAGMILLVLEDVTEKERIEQSLVEANKKFEQANLLKSQFLAAASHDLRQPLQSMRLLSAILGRQLTDQNTLKLNAKFKETIDVMNGVVNAILDINQLEAGAIKPAVQNFPANMLLDKLFDEFNFLVKAKGLEWRVLRCNAMLISDPRLLVQILRNLINNAIKFTGSGKILVGCRRRGGALSIEVWDSGPGIRDADMSNIFEFFHKGQASPTGVDDGLGLGLAIVRHLAEILGHEIRISSSVGKGSCFSIRVPIGQGAAPAAAPKLEPWQPIFKTGGSRILVVEDEPSVRETLTMLLTGEGHNVAPAETGQAGVDLVESGAFSPDVIIVDYSIPGGMNGLEAIDAMRAALKRQAPAIVLTGDISSATIARIEAKANIHLTKPVEADDLLEAIQKLRAASQVARAPFLAPPAPAPAFLTIPPRQERPSAAPLFIVDDDADIRESIRQLLEGFGHSVQTFAGGRELIAANVLGKDGCLILDARMPEMDGFETLGVLTARAAHPPVIMITGQGDVRTAVRAMKAGAFDFIEKPFDSDQLLASVNRALALSSNGEAEVSRRRAAAGVVARLTTRQRAVLNLIVAGHANKVIANELGIGQRTVESHRATVMKKLGVKTFADLIRVAIAAD
ncbi:MAG: CheR family methyltransferase [Methylocella sp.]